MVIMAIVWSSLSRFSKSFAGQGQTGWANQPGGGAKLARPPLTRGIDYVSVPQINIAVKLFKNFVIFVIFVRD